VPIPQLPGSGLGSLEDVKNYVIRLERELRFLMESGLDSTNAFEFGGWRVVPDQLASKDNDVGMSTVDTAADDIRFWAGDVKTGAPKFIVTKGGILYAVDGVFAGSVTADSGTIGGWVISATALSDASGAVGMSSAVTGGDDIRFWCGNITPSSAPFRVTEAGVLTASSGTIGGFTITATALTAITGGAIQNQTAAGNKVYLNDTGLHTNDSSGVERITIGTTPTKGAKALITSDSSGVNQGIYTYDTETVDGASRTGQYIVAHGCYFLLDTAGDIRMQDAGSKGFRTSAAGYPEMNDGFGWVSIAKQGLSGTKTYYVSDTSGGSVTRKLTFTDGILTSET